MPKCNCSQCSHRSLAKCNSQREDKCRCNRKRSPKRKPVVCECNKCKQPVKPTCKFDDYDNNDSDCETTCNTQSHQFIITVKTTN